MKMVKEELTLLLRKSDLSLVGGMELLKQKRKQEVIGIFGISLSLWAAHIYKNKNEKTMQAHTHYIHSNFIGWNIFRAMEI